MPNNRIVKFSYDDIRITVRERYYKWYIDFTFNKKRVKRGTSLSSSDKNLNYIKTTVIPELIVALTGNKEIEYFKKDISLDEFSIKYFESYKQTVREHVYHNNQNHYNNQIKPYFKDINIVDIYPMQLEEWQNKLLLKYKPNTVVKFRSILFSLFEKALSNDLIKINPLSRVKSPLTIKKTFTKLDDKEDELINPFNKQEVIKMLKNAEGNLYYVILIMLHTGIRPGELISVTWNDVDFEKKRIAIDKTTVNGKIGDVKTQSSVRYIDIIPNLEIKLKELYKITGIYDNIIVTRDKKPFYSHNILALRFRLLLKKIGIKERKIYNLRHTFASIMITDGQNILWVSKMLGHKDASITLKVYAKYIKEDDDIRIKKLSKIVPFFVPF